MASQATPPRGPQAPNGRSASTYCTPTGAEGARVLVLLVTVGDSVVVESILTSVEMRASLIHVADANRQEPLPP